MNRPVWRVRGKVLDPNQTTVIMGVVNVTPDSFSDGGLFLSTEAAIAHGMRLAHAGAHIVDVGGASTRPGAAPVEPAEEKRRVLDVVRELASAGVTVSVDTSHPKVAEACIEAGVAAVNDVTALATDGMAQLCAGSKVGVVLMHMQGNPLTMQQNPHYDNVVNEVRDFLRVRVEAVVSQGVSWEAVAIDPGIGFGKTLDHNLALLDGLDVLAAVGRPVVVGTSRKSFLGHLTGRGVEERDVTSAVSVGMAVLQGASVVRVHNVSWSADAVSLADAIISRRSK